MRVDARNKKVYKRIQVGCCEVGGRTRTYAFRNDKNDGSQCATDGQSFRGNGKLNAEQSESRRLKEQVKRLEMEIRILKEATVNSNYQRNSYIKKLFCIGFFDGAAKKNVYV